MLKGDFAHLTSQGSISASISAFLLRIFSFTLLMFSSMSFLLYRVISEPVVHHSWHCSCVALVSRRPGQGYRCRKPCLAYLSQVSIIVDRPVHVVKYAPRT